MTDALHNQSASADSTSGAPKTFMGIPIPVFWLGIVSFLTDISSEMIFSVLSVFLTIVLGTSNAILGLMEGLADFAASSLDYLSRYFSDRSGKRKIFALTGYAFSTLAKILLVFAVTVQAVITFRVVERLGKSIRGAPRDALISSIADRDKLGDSIGRYKIIALEYLLYAMICVGLMLLDSKLAVAGGLILVYGVFYTIDEGHTKAYISSLTSEDHRASALDYTILSPDCSISRPPSSPDCSGRPTVRPQPLAWPQPSRCWPSCSLC